MEAIEKEFEKVVKKQKLFHTKTQHYLDKILTAKDIEEKKEISDEIQNLVKDYYQALNKLGKAVDKKFNFQLDQVCPKNLFDQHTALICKQISLHFLRQGMFDLYREFLEESKMVNDKMSIGQEELEVQQKFQQMFEILQSLQQHNLEPALQWAQMHRQALQQKGSHLEFQLTSLKFLILLEQVRQEQVKENSMQSIEKCLQFAKVAFPSFGEQYLKEIQRLMGSLVYLQPQDVLLPLKNPYKDLEQIEEKWQTISQLFSRDFCLLLGLSQESPLKLTMDVGCLAFHKLMKLKSVLSESQKDRPKADAFQNLQESLPIEIELPKRYRFHSIFSCPVSREIGTDLNPPMMLLCGHVICRESLIRLAKGKNSGLTSSLQQQQQLAHPATASPITTGGGVGTSQGQQRIDVYAGLNVQAKVKCPYCPSESQVGQAIRIYF